MSDSLQEQLTALKYALRAGVVTASYSGQSVTYRSASDLRAAIADLEAEIAGKPPVKSFVIRSRKGW